MNGKFGLLEVRPHITYRGYWNFSGFQETSYLHVDNHWAWINGMEIHTGINFTTEGVVTPFEISEDIFVPTKRAIAGVSRQAPGGTVDYQVFAWNLILELTFRF